MGRSKLPSIDIPGVSFYWDKKRKRYRLQFTRNRRRKVITMQSTHPTAAYKEALEYAERYNAGRYNPWEDRARDQYITVREAVKKYRDSIKRLRPSTREQRKYVLEAFSRSVSGSFLLRALELKHLRDYYEKPEARASHQTYYNILNTWLNWCVKKRYLDKNPLEDVHRPKVPEGLPAYFTPEQFQTLLSHLRSQIILSTTLTGAAKDNAVEDYLDLAVLGVYTGLRRSELLHLRWMDVDFRTSLLHIRSYEDKRRGFSFRPKDSDARVVPMAPESRKILEQRHQGRSDEDDTMLIFPSPRSEQPRNRRSTSRQFKQYVTDAGLPTQLHFHSLRHTFASWLVSDGVPLVIVQQWMGHASIEQTMVYASLMPSALEWRGSSYHQAALKPKDQDGKAKTQEDGTEGASRVDRREL